LVLTLRVMSRRDRIPAPPPRITFSEIER